jgi:hypothetical protein
MSSSKIQNKGEINGTNASEDIYMGEIGREMSDGACRQDDSHNDHDQPEESYQAGLNFMDIFNDPSMCLQDILPSISPSDIPIYSRKHSRRDRIMRRDDSSAERSKGSYDQNTGSDHSVDTSASPGYGGSDVTKKKSSAGHGRNSEGMNAKAKNREHAKNTRLRKRQYIDSLKDKLKAVADSREKVDRDRKVALGRFVEQVI